MGLNTYATNNDKALKRFLVSPSKLSTAQLTRGFMS